jgi:small subunit ribosomal protein S2
MFYGKSYSISTLLEAGVHYGHKRTYWCPKMSRYIYGIRNGVHIIDLEQTVKCLERSLCILRDIALQDGRILFLSTKKQAQEAVAECATKCGQYYVTHRWLGGTFTNWRTVSSSIKTLRKCEEMIADEKSIFTKKEMLNLQRKRNKLELVLGGIRNMGGVPDALFVIGVRESITAIKEAKKMGIPVIAIVDTNCNPDNIDHVIPGNDDARKAVELYCHLASEAVLSGMRENMRRSGVDVGASEEISTASKGIDEAKNDEDKSQSFVEQKLEPKKQIKNNETKDQKNELSNKEENTANCDASQCAQCDFACGEIEDVPYVIVEEKSSTTKKNVESPKKKVSSIKAKSEKTPSITEKEAKAKDNSVVEQKLKETKEEKKQQSKITSSADKKEAKSK